MWNFGISESFVFDGLKEEFTHTLRALNRLPHSKRESNLRISSSYLSRGYSPHDRAAVGRDLVYWGGGVSGRDLVYWGGGVRT